jgi:hypothetical protein
MKKHLVLSTFAAIVMLISCKKDNKDNNAAAIEGTYKLKYLTAKTNATTTDNSGEKAVTTSDYTTINNQGTVVFANSTISATGLTYAVDTEAKYYLYDGVDLIDSSSAPFTFTLPSSNSVAQYKLIGADSIYFPQGSLTSGVGGTGSIQGSASGGRYNLSGGLLTITQIGSKDSTFEDSGETIHLMESAVSSVVLEKQ